MTFHYDNDADVLYVTFSAPPSRVHYVQTKIGDVLRYSDETGQVVGVTILFFMERIERGDTIEIPEIGSPNFGPIIDSIVAGRSRDAEKN